MVSTSSGKGKAGFIHYILSSPAPHSAHIDNGITIKGGIPDLF
jgi:hypothetical protein